MLKDEFPSGIDVIYESVGGEMFKTCLNALGRQGRLVIIGMMSQYGAGWPQEALKGVPEKLLYKSASLTGFFVIHYAHLFRKHLAQLTRLMMQGQLKVNMDSTLFRWVYSMSSACSDGRCMTMCMLVYLVQAMCKCGRETGEWSLSTQLRCVSCRGVDAVPDAVEHLQTGRSIGKVYVQIATDLPAHASSRL